MKYKGSRYCVLQETSNIFTMIISGWTRLRREGIYSPQKHTKYLEVPKEFFDQLTQLKGKITFNWTLHLMKKKVTPVKGYPSKLSYWISTRETFVSVNFCVNQKLWLPRYNQCVLITDTSIVCLAWAVDWLSAPGCLDVVSDLPSQTVYRVPTLHCSGIETCYNTRLA